MTAFNETEETALVRESSKLSLVTETKPEADETKTEKQADCDLGCPGQFVTLVPIEISEDAEDSKIQMEDLQNSGKGDIPGQTTFAGMGKEELMKYANNPFWVRLRWALFILFWIAWILMLAGAIVIIVLAPKCKPLPELSWWQESPIYQVYIRSFKDTDDNGIGDLQGLSSKMDYIDMVLGIKSVWLTPIYKSPNKDNGYDVSDYKSIDPELGSMESFEELLKKKETNDMHIIMDFIPNHSSDQHEWFQKSILRQDPYTNYYIWADAVDGKPPNNWLSVFGGSAWEWNESRQQYYYHQFLSAQPDLNLRNNDVLTEFDEILKFWLDKGVDGFRIDAASHLVESVELIDEPISEDPGTSGVTDYEYLDHVHTKDQPENLGVIKRWYDLLKTYESDGKPRLLITEVTGSHNVTSKYYSVCDFPMNFDLLNVLSPSMSGNDINNTVGTWLNDLPPLAWPNWVLGNHDQPRVASRVSQKLVDAFNMLIMLLPGTPITYYGEEIGMENNEAISFEDTKDTAGLIRGSDLYKKYSRDPFRTPMQWSSEKYAGFSTVKPWLPINPNYVNINVHTEKQSPQSHLSRYTELVKLRKSEALRFGDVDFPMITENIFSMTRVKEGTSGYLLVINLAPLARELNLSSSSIPDNGVVELRSSNTTSLPQSRAPVLLNNLYLEPYEAIIVNIVPKHQ